jgi:hypothetical protein
MEINQAFQSASANPACLPRRLMLALLAGTCILLVATGSGAQTAGAGGVVTSAPPANTETSSDALPWTQLSAAQKETLKPLEAFWSTLSPSHQRKWLAMAQTYPSMAASEQTRLRERMAEWAALSPQERTQARLNFAQSKKLAPTQRANNWEAYQALSPEERQKLADRPAAKPAGAALAIKPVPADRLAAVPVTRRSPQETRTLASEQRPIDRKTLLPQASAARVAASAPATGAK